MITVAWSVAFLGVSLAGMDIPTKDEVRNSQNKSTQIPDYPRISRKIEENIVFPRGCPSSPAVYPKSKINDSNLNPIPKLPIFILPCSS